MPCKTLEAENLKAHNIQHIKYFTDIESNCPALYHSLSCNIMYWYWSGRLALWVRRLIHYNIHCCMPRYGDCFGPALGTVKQKCILLWWPTRQAHGANGLQFVIWPYAVIFSAQETVACCGLSLIGQRSYILSLANKNGQRRYWLLCFFNVLATVQQWHN